MMRRRPHNAAVRSPRTSKGFTLIELLVTLGLLAIFLSMLATAFRAGYIAFHQTRNTVSAHQTARAALDALSNELGAARLVDLGVDGDGDDLRRAFEGTDDDPDTHTDGIRFTTTAFQASRRDPDEYQPTRPRVVEVRYFLDDVQTDVRYTGRVDAATADRLSVAGTPWAGREGEFEDYLVVMRSGAANGTIRRIRPNTEGPPPTYGNTADTVYLTADWSTNPANGDVFVIVPALTLMREVDWDNDPTEDNFDPPEALAFEVSALDFRYYDRRADDPQQPWTDDGVWPPDPDEPLRLPAAVEIRMTVHTTDTTGASQYHTLSEIVYLPTAEMQG